MSTADRVQLWKEIGGGVLWNRPKFSQWFIMLDGKKKFIILNITNEIFSLVERG